MSRALVARIALFFLQVGCSMPSDEAAHTADPDRAPVPGPTTTGLSLPDAAWEQTGTVSSCPAGMVEVRGTACAAVIHKCVEGGKTNDGTPSAEADPYYCNAYKPGYARCLGPESERHFCIDEYEWPNREGEVPLVYASWYDAAALCESIGKRLCGDDEWTLACEGPEHLPYPYGWRRDATKCNIDKRWIAPDDGVLAQNDPDAPRVLEELRRLSQARPSGAMRECRSPYGVMDMTGNVDEWTANVTRAGKPYRSVFKGGHWCGGARNRCRPRTDSHDETTRYYAHGFRCCADPTP